MILVTVGAQMPFDRLVRTVDAWASENGRSDVFAQIGPSDAPPAHIAHTRFLRPAEFRQRAAEAAAIVAHAGMGTIITALELRTPILVLPRRAALGETRNDHQVATASRFAENGLVHAAFDEHELRRKLEGIDTLPGPEGIRAEASERLLGALRQFVNE